MAREREKGNKTERERERREEGRVEGQLVPEEGQNGAYKYTQRNMCTSVCARRGRGGRDHGERCDRCISRVHALYSTSLRVVRLSYENKTDTQTIDIASPMTFIVSHPSAINFNSFIYSIYFHCDLIHLSRCKTYKRALRIL